MKKLFSLLLSVVMLLVPVIGCAEASSGYGYLTIANPYLSVTTDGETMELDLAGLELAFAAEDSEEAASLLVSVLANGNEALSGHVALDETGLYAALSGMETAVMIPMEALEELANEFLSELESAAADITIDTGVIGGADGPTSIVVETELGELDEFFSEEAMADFAVAAENFASSITLTDPVEDTMYENDAEVPAQRIDYNIENAPLAAVAQAFGDLLMTNEEFAAGYKEAIEEEGGEYVPLGDLLNEVVATYAVSVSGSLFMTESGSISADNYLYFTNDSGEEETVNLYLSMTSDEEGDYIYASLYPEGENYAELFFASMASAEVEGETDYYCDLTLFSGEEEEGSFKIGVTPNYDENGVVHTVADLTMIVDGDEISIGATWYAEESIYGGTFYFSATEFDGDATTTAEAKLGYDGEISADDLTHTGVLWAEFYADENEYGEFRSDISFGTDVSGASIAHDFSGYTMLDLTTASDDDFTAFGDEAGNVAVMGLLTIISEIPALASMMG